MYIGMLLVIIQTVRQPGDK